MLLTLVRHAKSSWDEPGLTDFERPLNARGQRDAPRIALWLARHLPRPDRLVSSPARRALETARAFAVELGIDATGIECERRIYEATSATLLDVLRGLGGSAAHVLLFGHNPGISELAHTLASCGFDELPTCGVAHLHLSAQHWREVAPGGGELLEFCSPKLLDPLDSA